MIIVSVLLFCWIFFIILFSFVKMRWGLGLYLMYIFLVPFLHINLGITFSYNFVNACVFCGFLWNNKTCLGSLELKPIVPIFFYFIHFKMECHGRSNLIIGGECVLAALLCL